MRCRSVPPYEYAEDNAPFRPGYTYHPKGICFAKGGKNKLWNMGKLQEKVLGVCVETYAYFFSNTGKRNAVSGTFIHIAMANMSQSVWLLIFTRILLNNVFQNDEFAAVQFRTSKKTFSAQMKYKEKKRCDLTVVAGLDFQSAGN